MLKNLRHCVHHKELGQEAVSKDYMLSQNTLQMFFSRIHHKKEPEEEKALIRLLQSPYPLELPIKCFKRAEVQEVINTLNPKKS
jgi:hypothetical protein